MREMREMRESETSAALREAIKGGKDIVNSFKSITNLRRIAREFLSQRDWSGVLAMSATDLHYIIKL